jgi:L-seryl-tRNA(Ser) seleniumtransferase
VAGGGGGGGGGAPPPPPPLVDRFGNRLAEGLPYARGAILTGTESDYAKLRRAWRLVATRHGESRLHNFTGLERSLIVGETDPTLLDDELAPAFYEDRLRQLALDHLGGDPSQDDVLLTNRLTAAIFAAMQVLVRPGSLVVGVSAGYTHPAVTRAVRFAGGRFYDSVGRAELAGEAPGVVVVTRLAVTYEALTAEQVEQAILSAHTRGAVVFVDDAGGARVGPAVLGQAKTLELGAELGATGLDKYGTTGPRLGLLAGRADLIRPIRARALELGLEARPMLFPAAVHSLERYRPERVRELVETTRSVGSALAGLLPWVRQTPVATVLRGEDLLAEAMGRAALDEPPIVPVEATAAVCMLLLRDHGVLTVHFAALPPGTPDLLLKFIPPETLARFGGADAFAAAVDGAVEELGRLLQRGADLRELLFLE